MAFGIDPGLVEDAIQDVFLSLYEGNHSLWESDNKKYYLLACLKNEIRSLKRRSIFTEEIENEDSYDFLLEVSGLDIIEQREEREAVEMKLQKVMNTLTGRQREAIYLRYIKERSFEDISEHFNIKTKAAQKLVYRAIDKMRIVYQAKPAHLILIGVFKHIFWGI